MSFNTCRVCKESELEKGHYPLVKYSVRHYAHADCALKKWGAAFFDRLTHYQLTRFPALAASRVGLSDELGRRIEQGASA
ncbi:hypothetical protein [Hydrocarboniphaga effusa]|uniref:hypothetical protein n=1 Tax=Hydrocarboniphaga effusa TaxID=243629 RepID=UPI00398BBFB6